MSTLMAFKVGQLVPPISLMYIALVELITRLWLAQVMLYWFDAGRTLNSEETDELIAAAAFMHVRREELARQFLNQDRWATH